MYLPIDLRKCTSAELKDLIKYSLWILEERKVVVEGIEKIKFTNELKDIKMSTRLYNILRSLGMHSLSEISEYYPSDFLRCRNAGKNAIDELEQLMKEHNLNWKK